MHPDSHPASGTCQPPKALTPQSGEAELPAENNDTRPSAEPAPGTLEPPEAETDEWPRYKRELDALLASLGR